MHEGLFLLWILAVGVSLASWFYLEVSLATEGGTSSRRQITGCEFAREILDHNHLSQTAIQPTSGIWRIHQGLDFDRLLLAEKIYYGTKIGDLAQALHEAGHLLTDPKSFFPLEFGTQGGRILRTTVLVSWFLIVGGILFPAARWMTPLGQFLFVTLVFRALAFLGKEWEVTEQALANLGSLEGVGPEERSRMAKLLKALRWAPLAELFGEPFSFFFQNKRKIPAGVS